MGEGTYFDLIKVLFSYVMSFLPSVVFLYLPFRKVMTKQKKKIFELGAFFLIILLIIVAYFVISIFGMSDLFYKLNSGTFFFLFLFWVLHCCKEKKAAILFNFGVIGIIILLIAGLASYIVDHIPMQLVFLEMSMIYFGLLALISIPMFLLLNHNAKLLMSIVEGGDWNDIWFLPFSIMIVCAFSTPMESHANNIFDVLCRLMCGLFAIFISQYLSHSREAQIEKNNLLTELSSQKEHYKEISRKMKEDRKIRHDFRHAIMAIRSYIDADDKDGLVSYCEKLLENSVYGETIPFSGNSVADGIFYRYMLLTSEENIRFDIKGTLRNDVIDDMDMCVLLGNALENALEACRYVNSKDKWIGVQIEESETLLTITIRNTFDGNIKRKKGKIFSRKRENEEGIGLQSIRLICERYGGLLYVSYDEDIFQVMMFLNLAKSDKNG